MLYLEQNDIPIIHNESNIFKRSENKANGCIALNTFTKMKGLRISKTLKYALLNHTTS